MEIVSRVELRNLILSMIKDEIHPSRKELDEMFIILNKASFDELGRIYDSFVRFGVSNILNNIM